MRILQVLTYYRPHISGLTIYAQHLSRSLAGAGHRVTVLTSQYDPSLPLNETQDGVDIVRVPVLFRLSKGVIMPSFGNTARRLIRTHDVAHLHLPQFDGAGLAINAHRLRKPVVLTYHCDIQLPPGALNALAGPAIRFANRLAARYTDRLVAYTEDYARHSPFLSRQMSKLQVIPPPVEIDPPARADIDAFANKWHLNGTHRPVIGMVARLATEKGVEVLVAGARTHPPHAPRCARAFRRAISQRTRRRSVCAPVATVVRCPGPELDFHRLVAGRRVGCVLRQLRRDGAAQPELDRVVRTGAGGVDVMRHAVDLQRLAGRARGCRDDGHG